MEVDGVAEGECDDERDEEVVLNCDCDTEAVSVAVRGRELESVGGGVELCVAVFELLDPALKLAEGDTVGRGVVEAVFDREDVCDTDAVLLRVDDTVAALLRVSDSTRGLGVTEFDAVFDDDGVLVEETVDDHEGERDAEGEGVAVAETEPVVEDVTVLEVEIAALRVSDGVLVCVSVLDLLMLIERALLPVLLLL